MSDTSRHDWLEVADSDTDSEGTLKESMETCMQCWLWCCCNKDGVVVDEEFGRRCGW